MSKFFSILRWAGIVILGLASGILEDIMFITVIVPNMPASWDLTGDLFFIFTVPLAQLMALAITGTLAWFLLGLKQIPKLITFWACWSFARAVFLFRLNNPVEDVLIYLFWIATWCALIGLLAHFVGKRQQLAAATAESV